MRTVGNERQFKLDRVDMNEFRARGSALITATYSHLGIPMDSIGNERLTYVKPESTIGA